MHYAQNALINYIPLNFQPALKTVKPYAGELKDINRLMELLPAAMPVYVDGSHGKNKEWFKFDLLIITETCVTDKDANWLENLKLLAQFVWYFREHYIIPNSNLASFGNYILSHDPEEFKTRKVLITDQIAVTALTLQLTNSAVNLIGIPEPPI